MENKRLLIADNDPRVRHTVDRIAKELGYTSARVNQASQFGTVYHDLKPDVILLDLQMEGIDGVELLRYLADQNARIPILLMSCLDYRFLNITERLGKSYNLNMRGVLCKPIDP